MIRAIFIGVAVSVAAGVILYLLSRKVAPVLVPSWEDAEAGGTGMVTL